ncbi:hypothetical protein Syun_008148 [Stephania yunnanensis]|uniref:Protein NIM1-INTERACTING 1-like n=1 Tax=Stephania yunnanensis TaxID=152371 RepID=A0AAP0L1H3_9MAGN
MEKNKRPMTCEDDADLEDQKMEKFFDLIKTFQEARARLRFESDGGGAQERSTTSNKKTKKEIISVGGSERSRSSKEKQWVPSFEWRDFTEKVEFDRSRLPRDSRKDGDRDHRRLVEEVEDDRLDLTLAL